jgi:transposase-like protein
MVSLHERRQIMTIDELKEMLPTEQACRSYLEQSIWRDGRVCPHCGCLDSWELNGKTTRSGLYECSGCHGHFTVTTKTPMHGTKLPLWTWILAMYYILSSSKGVSSVILSRLTGVSQKTGWKLGHAIREMMDMSHEMSPAIGGVVEIDEKYVGGKPRKEKGVTHKRGKGTSKQPVLVMVERNGIARAKVIDNDSFNTIAPEVERHVDQQSYLMTDQHLVYQKLGKQYAGHSYVNHGDQEYARGEVHNNTAESFNAILERAKQGVFHWLSKWHLQRYVNEIAFRWNHRQPIERKSGKISFVPLPMIDQLKSLLSHTIWRQVRRSQNGGIKSCSNYV